MAETRNDSARNVYVLGVKDLDLPVCKKGGEEYAPIPYSFVSRL